MWKEGVLDKQIFLFLTTATSAFCRYRESWTQWRRAHVCSGDMGGGGGDCFRISVLMVHNMNVLTPVLSGEPLKGQVTT